MLISKTVIPNNTSILLKPMDDLFMLPDDNIVVISDISGDLTGTMIASFEMSAGMKIINSMLGRDLDLIMDLGEEEVGALKEYVNIVGGTFLTEFGNSYDYKTIPEILCH